MRVLILGGTGFIGPFVARQLAEQGHEVTLFHRGRTEADLPAPVRHMTGDRNELARHRDAFARLAPEVVLDMRPLTEQDARAAVEAFRGIARRLVAISSQDVYRAYGRLIGTEPGPPDPVPLTEESPLREKRYPYRGETPRPADDPRRWTDDYDKILVEQVVMGAPDLPGTVLRLPMVYGPRDGQHRLYDYLKRMDDDRPAILLDERSVTWRWTRGYVENVAAAIALAITDNRAAGRVYNVGEEPALPLAEWVRRVAAQVGWNGRIVAASAEQLPEALVAQEDMAHDLAVDTSRLRRELGYQDAIPQDEALRRTIAWERANPPASGVPTAEDYAAEDEALARMA